jgi:hypothetical protein
VDTGENVLKRVLEQNRLHALERKRWKRLAYEWHLMRRRREQGRLTNQQWLMWARQQITNEKASPWRDFCEAQVRKISALDALYGRD